MSTFTDKEIFALELVVKSGTKKTNCDRLVYAIISKTHTVYKEYATLKAACKKLNDLIKQNSATCAVTVRDSIK
jgi:hypothetical protein